MAFSWKKPLESALQARAELIEGNTLTNCFRLFNGQAEGIPGLVIERYGEVLIFQIFDEVCVLSDSQLREAATWLLRETSTASVYKKLFVVDRSKKTAGNEYYDEEPFVGDRSASVIKVLENGIKYEIQPYSGYSTGLFLDQRDNRKFLANASKSKRVLNLFAYTCGFSVACASAGALTTSVDLSKKYLEWGKRNFELNQLDFEGQLFIQEDCLSFLKKTEKKGLLYDLVIVDPPSFSRSKTGGVFSIKKDLERLLSAVVSKVAPQGTLFFSSNYSEWSSRYLKEKAFPILNQTGKWKWIHDPEIPTDFLKADHTLSQFIVQKE